MLNMLTVDGKQFRDDGEIETVDGKLILEGVEDDETLEMQKAFCATFVEKGFDDIDFDPRRANKCVCLLLSENKFTDINDISYCLPFLRFINLRSGYSRCVLCSCFN